MAAEKLEEIKARLDAGAEVRASLEAAEAELASAEHSAPAAALRVHLGKAEPGDAELLARLPALRQNVENLRLAVQGAEAEEALRRVAERARAQQAAANAVRQHLGKVERGAKRAAVLLAELNTVYADMVTGVRAAFNVNPRLVGNTSIMAPANIARAFLAHAIGDSRTRGIETFAPKDSGLPTSRTPAPARSTPWPPSTRPRSTASSRSYRRSFGLPLRLPQRSKRTRSPQLILLRLGRPQHFLNPPTRPNG